MDNEGGGGVIGIGGGMGTGGGSPMTRGLGIGQGPTKKKGQKAKKPIIRNQVGYKKGRMT